MAFKTLVLIRSHSLVQVAILSAHFEAFAPGSALEFSAWFSVTLR